MKKLRPEEDILKRKKNWKRLKKTKKELNYTAI